MFSLMSLTANRAAVLILGALTLLVCATFQDYGITWDEEVQNIYGQKILALYSSGFADKSALSFMNLYFYGGFFDTVAAAVNLVSPFGEYETRHLLGGLMGVFGYAGVYLLARMLGGDRVGLVALVLLVTTPLLYGHALINPKDAPFAWLTVWTLYFGCRSLMQGEDATWSTILGLGVMLGLALGTRVIAAAWFMAIVGAHIVAVVSAQPHQWRDWWDEFRYRAAHLVWTLPLAVALMAIFWPWSVTSAGNVETAVQEFAAFPWDSDVLWNGQLIMADALPWAYLPVLLLYVLPELMLAGLAIVVVPLVLRVRRLGIGLAASPQASCILLVAVVAIVPIIACMILRPTLYNGMRHFLFVVPLLGILAALGLTWAFNAVLARRRYVAYCCTALFAVGIARQVWITIDLHPNQYVYYNALAGDLVGVQGRFELDYWGSSLAEASKPVAAIIANGPAPDGGWKVEVCGHPNSVLYYLPPGVAHTFNRAEAHFYVGLNITACRNAPTAATQLSEVTRRGVVFSRAFDLR